MTEPLEATGLQQRVKTEVFDKKPESWDAVRASVVGLTQEAFGEAEENPLLAGEDDIVVYPNLETAFLSPDTTAVLIRDEALGEVIGYSLAMPIDRMYPERSAEASETAYIYYTVLAEGKRGMGLVGKLIDPLHLELDRKGYSFVERDAHIEGGYADTISRHYANTIVKSHDHNNWPEIGPERFFRIDNRRYVQGLRSGT